MAVCPDLPDAPAPNPPPTVAPVPPQTPAPAPAPGQPPIVVPKIILDVQNSFMQADCFQYNGTFTLAQVISTGMKQAQNSTSLILVLQNTKAAAGSVGVQVTADNANLVISPTGVQTVSVPASNFVQYGFTLTASITGTYVVTIDVGGKQVKINVVIMGGSCEVGGA